MNFIATKSRVFTRGIPSDAFLTALVNWARYAPNSIFSVNGEAHDIMDQIKPELGPWKCLAHRRAALTETLRVLGMFESTGNFQEDKDPDNHNPNPESWEAGAWQVSYDSRSIGGDLRDLLFAEEIHDAIQFQSLMKGDSRVSAEYIARLLRHTWKANGPCYKDRHIFPHNLQGPEQSIYPWLSRDAASEFQSMI